MTSTISKMSIVPGKNYKSEEAPMFMKILWGILMAAIAILFLWSGGLDGAKSVKAITGFPVFILELAACIGFIMFFVKGKAPEKNVRQSLRIRIMMKQPVNFSEVIMNESVFQNEKEKNTDEKSAKGQGL